MWTITQTRREQFEQAHVLVIRESNEEWAQAIEEGDTEYEAFRAQYFEKVKEQLFMILPEYFHPYITNGSINRRDIPPVIRTAYLQWQREQDEVFRTLLDTAFMNKQYAISYMPEHVQQVFLDSLHDCRVMHAIYGDDSLQINFDTSGGFSAKSFISVTLTDILSEQCRIEAGDNYVYDELLKTADGIAWRVLLNTEKEWTIEAAKWNAQFYFAPKAYFDFHGSDDFDEYIKTLDITHGLHFIAPAVQTKITSLTPFCTEAGILTVSDAVYIGDVRVADTLAACIPFIHSELYEDPQAIFSEPVAKADLLDYALGADLEKKVRAWNTMYANPQELAPIINQILLQMDREKEDEMLQTAYVNHFSKEGILTLAVWQKFSDLLK
ncbi:MAG: DUF4085 family protein [Solibacillus sp.]